VDGERVEERRVHLREAHRGQTLLERGGQGVDPRGDGREALGPVIHGVHRGHVGQQGLGRADVGGRLLASDVLFTRGERHAEGALASGVHRDADDPAGRLTHERLARREKGRVRSAVAHGDAEAL
jgi:hypothetical protein